MLINTLKFFEYSPFLTAHTPDNSFLGFVVEQHLNSSDIKHINDIKRQNQSLVYGKVDNFWKVSFPYLIRLSKFILIDVIVHNSKLKYSFSINLLSSFSENNQRIQLNNLKSSQ